MKNIPRVLLGLVLLSLVGCVGVPVDRDVAASHEAVRMQMEHFREESARATRAMVADPSKY